MSTDTIPPEAYVPGRIQDVRRKLEGVARKLSYVYGQGREVTPYRLLDLLGSTRGDNSIVWHCSVHIEPDGHGHRVRLEDLGDTQLRYQPLKREEKEQFIQAMM